MILVLVPKITNRIKYIFGFILRDLVGTEYRITESREEFADHQGPKFHYGHNPIGNELFFACRNLLFETGIRDPEINVFDWNGVPAFFATPKASAIPFDIFSASFFMISRYEEYLPTIRDKYDRFDAHESLAFKNGFITKPVVNIWGQSLKHILRQNFPDLHFAEKKYTYQPTVDVDNAYAYREKGIVRVLGGYMRALLSGNFSELKERTRVHLGLEKDPYDTFDQLYFLEKKYRLKPIYFFLVADYGLNDKNVPLQSRKFRSLIKSISDHAPVGIHPSFASNSSASTLSVEVARLSRVINREITKSRQHFLKLQLPHTYRNLLDLDITDDYTMGYASEVGFRAGVCTPFMFYDLDYETETRLRVHPFQVMEATLKHYMKLSPSEGIERAKQIVDEIKKVNGTFTTLWHNESLTNRTIWAGWRDVYEKIIQYAIPAS